MTVVTGSFNVPGQSGLTGFSGSLWWVPTARHTSGSGIVLPVPFIAQVDSNGTMTPINVDPTGPTWVWKVTEQFNGIAQNVVRYVQVPASGPVAYKDLVDVDPNSLQPSAPVPGVVDGGTAALPNRFIQERRDTAANWTAVNPILNSGEQGLETDTGRRKRGDGVTTWTALGYQFDQTASDLLYSPKTGRRPGNLFVFLGDSLTAGSDDVVANSRGEAWPVYASIFSKQKIRYVRNAGVAGNTTLQMLNRFDTDVTPYNPTVVTLACGTNDTGVTDFVTWQGQVKSIIAKIRAINAVPVLLTMPPNNLATPTPDRKFLVNQWNAWLRLYAGQQGIALVDMYPVLVDPTNSNYLAAYYSDGTHPNSAGRAAMAQAFVNAISPILAPYGPVLCNDDNDEQNAISRGCFSSYVGTALPTGWFDNAGTPTGSALSATTDAAVQGKLFTITSTASSALRQIAFNANIGSGTVNTAVSAGATTITISADPSSSGVLYIGTGATAEAVKSVSRAGSSGAWTVTLNRGLRYSHSVGEPVVVNGAPGDVMQFTGLTTTDGNTAVRVGMNAVGVSNTSRAMADLSQAITRGMFLTDYTIASGTTILQPYIQIPAASTSVSSFGQIGLYNVTRQGLAGIL